MSYERPRERARHLSRCARTSREKDVENDATRPDVGGFAVVCSTASDLGRGIVVSAARVDHQDLGVALDVEGRQTKVRDLERAIGCEQQVLGLSQAQSVSVSLSLSDDGSRCEQ